VFHNLKTRVFKVQHGDPDELANEILGLLAPYGVTPTGEGEGGVYIVPLTRLNSLVAVAFDRAMFDEIEHWLHLLDIPPEEGAGPAAGGASAAAAAASARAPAARGVCPGRRGRRAPAGARAASRSRAGRARLPARRASRRARSPSSRRRCGSSPIRSPTRSSCSPPSATTSSSPRC